MSRQRELAKNTAILTVGKICTQCISFFLLPLYTALLDTAEYGLFDLLITYGTLLLPLVNWQFDQGIFRFMLDCREDHKGISELFSTVFVVNTGQSLLYLLIIGIFSYIISFEYAAFIILYVILHVYTALFLQFARGLGKSKVYAAASFISASSTVLFNVFTLVILGMGLGGLFIATLLSQVLTILYLCTVIRPWKYFNIKYINKSTFTRIRKYSLPLIPNNLAWWVVNVSDRTIISYILGVALNGIYTVANKFSNIFINFYNIFNLSWTETVSLHYDDEDRDIFLSEMITTMYKLFTCACFGIVACMPFIFPLMINERYADAYPQIIILMYAMLFRVVVGLYSCVYIATKESKKIAYTSVASAVINIAANLLLIGRLGLYAASISTLVAFASMAIIRYIDINKAISMKISSPILISSIILGCMLAITYYINETLINILMLIFVCIYSFIMNRDLAASAVKLVLSFIKLPSHKDK